MARGRHTMQTQHLGRRGLSLLMALVMTLSLVQITVFATETQTLPAVSIAYNGDTAATATSGDLSISGKKTIAAVSGTDNQFDITLQVTTTSTSTSSIVTTPADVVLVMDVTESMDEGNKWTDMKSAATSFINALLPAGNANNRVAIVTYGGKGYNQLSGWQTSASAAQVYYKNAASSDALRGAIDGWSNSNHTKAKTYGTNCQAGFLGADLQLDTARDAALKYVVYLTDGAANRYYTASEYFYWDGWSLETGYKAVTTEDLASNSYTDSTYDNTAPSTTCAIKQAAALKANHSAAKLIAVGIGTETNNRVINKTYNTNLDSAYSTGTLNISQILADISQEIIANADSSAATVTDPMSGYVTFNSVQTTGTATGEVTAPTADNTQTLSWDLSKATPVTTTSTVGGKTVYTKVYTLTYRITVDRTETFYAAVVAAGKTDGTDVGVPTNNATTLPYSLNGTTGTLDFNVPRVTSALPTLQYTIHYFKQGTAAAGSYANYTEDTHATITGTGTLFETVNPPAAYADKYNSDNYHYAIGDPASVRLSLTGANAINLYYNRDTTSATVNHYYKLTIYAQDGTRTVGDYPEAPDAVDTDTGLYVGDSYTAQKQTTFGGVAYQLDTAATTATSIDHLSAVAANNVLNLYYQAEIDNRKDANVQVDHVYRTHTWTLVNGTYQPVMTTATVTGVETATQKAHTSYTAATTPTAGNESFTYDSTSDKTITDLREGANVITLYFDKTVDARQSITVTVNHHYTKTTTTIDASGAVQIAVDPNNAEVTETSQKYVGESFTAVQVNTYNGETYVSDAGNADKLSIAALNTTNQTIDLYYTLLSEPGTTTVTVNHIYRTITHETVAETDENGTVTGTKVVDSTTVDSTDPVTSASLYVGQLYTAALAGKEGYTFNGTASDSQSTKAQADNASVINLYYDKDEKKDERETATIAVQHVYTTHLQTVQNGQVTTIDVTVINTDQPTTGQAGDSFTAVEEPTYGDNTYTVVGTPELGRVLQSGTNSTVVIPYERDASNLVPAAYTVNYVYKTYTMTVKDGVADYYDDPVVENGTQYTRTGSVGEIISDIPDGAQEGFKKEGTNPATTLTLSDGTNELTFTYAKHVPLDTVSVTVHHHYTTTTIAENGTSTTAASDTDIPAVTKFAGETAVAAAALNGFTLDSYTVTEGIAATQDASAKDVTVTATANTEVNFYYSKTVDNSVRASYTIQHIYKTYDWNGDFTTTSPKLVTGTGYATNQVTATADDQSGSFTLVSATYNGAALADPYSFTLQAGANNAVVFTYEKHIDTRTATSVTVIHKYFNQDTYVNHDAAADYIAAAAPEFTVENVYNTIAQGAWVGNSFTAVQAPDYVSGTGASAVTYHYTFVSAEPADGKIASLTAAGADQTGNVIVLNYIRQTSSDPGDGQYTVVHQYYLDGALAGSTTSTVTAKNGVSVSSSDITRVPVYGGRTYTFSAITPEAVTVGRDQNPVFTLTYTYTTPDDRDDDDDDDDDTPIVVPDNPTPLNPTPTTPRRRW
jgi:hypothetical protein